MNLLLCYNCNYSVSTKRCMTCCNNFNLCCTNTLCSNYTISINSSNWIARWCKCEKWVIYNSRYSTVGIDSVNNKSLLFRFRSIKVNIRISNSNRNYIIPYCLTINNLSNNCIITIIWTSTIATKSRKCRTVKWSCWNTTTCKWKFLCSFRYDKLLKIFHKIVIPFICYSTLWI